MGITVPSWHVPRPTRPQLWCVDDVVGGHHSSCQEGAAASGDRPSVFFLFLHAADLSDPDTFRDQEGKVSDREMRSASLTLKQVGEKLGKRPLQQPMNRKQARTCWCTHRRQNLAAVHHGDPSAESGLPERSQRRSESCDKDLPVK
jgi:hypothetical protein